VGGDDLSLAHGSEAALWQRQKATVAEVREETLSDTALSRLKHAFLSG